MSPVSYEVNEGRAKGQQSATVPRDLLLRCAHMGRRLVDQTRPAALNKNPHASFFAHVWSGQIVKKGADLRFFHQVFTSWSLENVLACLLVSQPPYAGSTTSCLTLEFSLHFTRLLRRLMVSHTIQPQVIGDPFYFQSYGIALQDGFANFTFAPKLSEALLALRESGLTDRLSQIWFPGVCRAHFRVFALSVRFSVCVLSRLCNAVTLWRKQSARSFSGSDRLPTRCVFAYANIKPPVLMLLF